MYNLSGRVALVTGAARYPSTGRSIALRLAQEGADVAVHGSPRPPHQFTQREREMGWQGTESVKAEIEALGRRAVGVQAEVTSPADVERMVREVVALLGHIDILVNNAAIAPKGELLKTAPEVWSQALAVNLTGPFLCGREAARQMMQQGTGGKIVNISSRAGRVGVPGQGAYSASKFGLIGLTQVMALEWARYSINVNAIYLGIVEGSGSAERRPWEAGSPEQIARAAEEMSRALRDRASAVPLGRNVTQEDVGNLVCFLASDQSAFITGESIDLSGGYSLT